MNCKLFNKIVIGIATIALAITPMVYFVFIYKIWAIMAIWEAEVYIVITAIASVAIACFALWANIREGKETRIEREENREHNRILVRPFLTTSVIYSPKDNKGIAMECREFKITNKGIGPAVITDIKLFFNGDPILYNNHEDCKNALREKILNNSIKVDIGLKSTSIAPGYTMAIGEEEMMWSIEFDRKIERSKIVENFDNIQIRIEYESVYKEKIHPPIDTRRERKLS